MVTTVFVPPMENLSPQVAVDPFRNSSVEYGAAKTNEETFWSVVPEKRSVTFVTLESVGATVQKLPVTRPIVMSRNSRTESDLAPLSWSVVAVIRLVDAPCPTNVRDAGLSPKNCSVPIVCAVVDTETVTGLASVQSANDAVAEPDCG